MSAKLTHSLTVNDTIIVTWANFALWDFVQNWVGLVRQQGARRPWAPPWAALLLCTSKNDHIQGPFARALVCGAA